MANISEVEGSWEPKFETLVELFSSQGPENPAGGTTLAVYQDGKSVVNVWQGQASPESKWSEDTVSVVFSCTKGIISILAAQLIQQGLLDLEERVATYWPEFAQAGKENIKVKTLLQHRAGLSAVRRDLTYEEVLDEKTIIEELASQAPLWDPDTNYGYHALTFGHLVSKLIHSVTGFSANDYLQKVVTAPLGVDMWIGLPSAQLPRIATLVSDGGFKSANPSVGSDQYWVEKAMGFGGALPVDPTDAHGFNDPRTLGIELAGANGVTNANGLAKIYSAAVTETDGIRLLSDQTLEIATKPASYGKNVWNEPGPYPAWGNGFMLPIAEHFEMPGAKGFGHNGLGGSAGWGSVEKRIGFGYTTSFLRSSPDTQKHQQDLVRHLQKLTE